MSSWMSLIEFSLTTTMRGICRATRACILTKEYQRPTLIRLRLVGACSISRRRSTVMGWWSVTMVGSSRSMASRP